jgi:peptidyl-prolyl cis-trans isomerase SurA
MRTIIKLRCVLVLATVTVASGAAITIDRIAVIVGRHAIKSSDIDRDIRVTAFLNRGALDFGSQTKHQSADRLVDQELIRQEIATGTYHRPPDTEGDALEAELIHDRFNSSQADYNRALERYGVTPDQLRSQLLWQTTVLQFIDQRFRAGVFVSDDDVQKYCQVHQAELRKQSPQASADGLQSKCRDTMEGEQVNRNFDEWLQEQHNGARIEYKPEAFT